MRLSRTATLGFLGAALVVPSLLGDVSMSDKRALIAQRHAAKLQKKAQAGKHAHRTSGVHRLGATSALSNGSQALIDSSGLEWFINTNITSSTSSSASGAVSEATYTHGVAASTSAGGTTSSTLSDAYDGYNAMCVSLTNQTGPCETGDADYVMYNNNGPATTECPAFIGKGNRQVVLPVQTIGGLAVQRKVFVPENDSFARWENIFTNTTGAPITFTMITSNNLGSDSNTTIVSSSNGNAVAETSDTWVTTFQNFSGNTSDDPRLGHVLQGAGAAVPVSFIDFTNGDTSPWWAYQMTLGPGETRIIVNFGVGQPTKAAANAKSALLATFPAPSTTTQCMTPTELSQVVNFAPGIVVPTVPTLTPKVIALFAALLALSAIWLLRRS